MGLFDDLFDKKEKSTFEKVMDESIEKIVNSNPITREFTKLFDDTAEGISKSFETEVHGHPLDHSGDKPALENFDENSKYWDKMYDKVVDKQLGQYKECPKCHEVAPADAVFCMRCGEKLPEHTLAYKTCPYCGAQSKQFDTFCRNCGKKFEIDLEK